MRFLNVSSNVAALVSMLIGIVNFTLMYKIYGATEDSDAYFISLNTLNVLFMIISMFIAQYPLRFRAILKDKVGCKSLYTSMLLMSFVVSIFLLVIALLLYYFQDEIRIYINDHLFVVLFFSSVVYLPNQIFINTISSAGKVTQSYFVVMLPNLFVLFSLVLMDNDVTSGNILNVALGYVIGSYVSFLVGCFLCRNFFERKVRFKKSDVFSLMLVSFKIRFSANIHNVILNLLVINMLSGQKDGVASVYYYAKKIADIIHSVLYGPSSKLIQNSVVDSISLGNLKQVLSNAVRINLSFFLLYLLVYFTCYYSLPIILPFIGGDFQLGDDFYITLAFLMLANSVICCEGIYHCINQIHERYKTIILANILFILLFALSINVYANLHVNILLSLSILLGQLVVLATHYFRVKYEVYYKQRFL